MAPEIDDMNINGAAINAYKACTPHAGRVPMDKEAQAIVEA